jgi:hypothetical protein
MVAKCANPACGRAFRYLREGRLFRLERDPAFDSGAEFEHSIEYFWVCGACSDSMTLRLDPHSRIFPEHFESPPAGHAGNFAIISRHGGLQLRNVVISPKPTAAGEYLRDVWPPELRLKPLEEECWIA